MKGDKIMSDNDKKYHSDLPRPNSYNKKPKKIAPLSSNSDNEKTQYVNVDSFSETGEFNVNQGNQFDNQQYYNNENYDNQNYGNQNYQDYNNQNNFQQYNGYRQPPQQPNNNVNYHNGSMPRPQNIPHLQNGNAPRMQNQGNYPPRHEGQVNQPNQRPVQPNIPQNNYGNHGNINDRPSVPQQRMPQQQRPPQRPPQHQRPQPQKPVKQKKIKKKRRFRILRRIIISLLSFVLVIFIIYSALALFFIKKMNYVESDITSYSGLMYDSHVKNILLIGTDGRTKDDRGRSDTMILLSINSKTNKMYLTSLMRDSYVDIQGHGNNKLNAAYSFGGADLLIDTIQRNFKIEITDYISVNFNAFATVVDAVDGIEVEISDREAEAINQILHDEVNQIMGDPIDADYLSGGGKVKLNGKQALSYARIRHVGNADFERTERQREVLTKIAGKAKSFNPSKITKIMKSALPEMTTNMGTMELYLLSLRAPFILTYDMEQLRVPAENTYHGEVFDCGDSLVVDFGTNIDMLKKEIYDD